MVHCRQITQATLDILMAEELIAVNQDPLGIPGDLIWKQGANEVRPPSIPFDITQRRPVGCACPAGTLTKGQAQLLAREEALFGCTWRQEHQGGPTRHASEGTPLQGRCMPTLAVFLHC